MTTQPEFFFFLGGEGFHVGLAIFAVGKVNKYVYAMTTSTRQFAHDFSKQQKIPFLNSEFGGFPTNRVKRVSHGV